MLSLLKKHLKLLFIIFSLLWLITFTQKDNLPDKSQIAKPLFNEPLQNPTIKPAFKAKVKGETYALTPVATYELYGLIVSSHKSSSWMDITHEEAHDFLNMADICVVYGDNISSDVYRHIKVTSGDWTCYVEWSGSQDQKFQSSKKFNNRDLANNHILTDNDALKNEILAAHKGDQIYFKGYLVNYTNSDKWQSQTRNSSLTRDDQGCEVVYVTDFKILKKSNTLWRFMHAFSGWMLLLLVVLFFF